jgi:hypothetical protein
MAHGLHLIIQVAGIYANWVEQFANVVRYGFHALGLG